MGNGLKACYTSVDATAAGTASRAVCPALKSELSAMRIHRPAGTGKHGSDMTLWSIRTDG